MSGDDAIAYLKAAHDEYRATADSERLVGDRNFCTNLFDASMEEATVWFEEALLASVERLKRWTQS